MRVASAKIIRRVFEQRITRNLNFMVVNVGLRFGQPDGLGVRNEVNLMAPLRQFQSKFGGDHTAAAVSGITGYANSHYAVP